MTIPGGNLEELGHNGSQWYWCKICKKRVDTPVSYQEEDEITLCCPDCLLNDLGEDAFMAMDDVVEAPDETAEVGDDEAVVNDIAVTLEKPWDESVDTSADDDEGEVSPQVEENIPIYEYT